MPWLKRDSKSIALGIVSSDSFLSEWLRKPLFSRMNIEFRPPSQDSFLFDGRQAAGCISIDFDVTRPDRFVSNRVGTRRLIELSEKYDIPMTWAVCGMTAEQDPESYRLILNSDVKHEIGVHTYSHIAIPDHDDATIKKDIERCISVLNLPYRPKTFVFPWNREGRHSLIKELGFIAYRGKYRAIGLPQPKSGMFNVAPVQYLGASSFGNAKLVNKLMDVCTQYHSVFHLWFHPWDLVKPSLDSFCDTTLEPVLAHMAQLRDAGRMSTMTVGNLAESYASTTSNTESKEEV